MHAVGSGFVTDNGTKIPIDEVKIGDKIMFRSSRYFTYIYTYIYIYIHTYIYVMYMYIY